MGRLEIVFDVLMGLLILCMLADVVNHYLVFKKAPKEGKPSFFRNYRKSFRHNIGYRLGFSSYEMGLNEFSNMSETEFGSAMFNAESWSPDSKNKPFKPTDLPEEFDWRSKGYVTEVENQGLTKASFAYAAIGVVEARLKKDTGNLTPLSVQYILNCLLEGSDTQENKIKRAVALAAKGAFARADYKELLDECPLQQKKSKIAVGTVFDNEDALKQVIATVGPVAAGIDATPDFQHYKSGVFYDLECTNNTKHAVLIIGYGADAVHGDYWLVKNSWGKSWGEDGYARIARNRNGHCGITKNAYTPIKPVLDGMDELAKMRKAIEEEFRRQQEEKKIAAEFAASRALEMEKERKLAAHAKLLNEIDEAQKTIENAKVRLALGIY